jgi:Mn-dependent DtxR family transcriptional regulator
VRQGALAKALEVERPLIVGILKQLSASKLV